MMNNESDLYLFCFIIKYNFSISASVHCQPGNYSGADSKAGAMLNLFDKFIICILTAVSHYLASDIFLNRNALVSHSHPYITVSLTILID